jgi:alpha-tubulin suppressor-like RCC1 family protein
MGELHVGRLGYEGGKDEPTPSLIKTHVDQGIPMASNECGEFHTVGLTQDGEVWVVKWTSWK